MNYRMKPAVLFCLLARRSFVRLNVAFVSLNLLLKLLRFPKFLSYAYHFILQRISWLFKKKPRGLTTEDE